MFRKTVVSYITLLLFANLAYSQPSGCPHLFQITAADGSLSSALLGVTHVGMKLEEAVPDAALTQLLDETQVVAFEVEIEDYLKFSKSNSEGMSNSRTLSKEAMDRLETLRAKHLDNFSREGFFKLNPNEYFALLGLEVMEQDPNFASELRNAASGVDMTLQMEFELEALANRRRIPTAGLASPAEHSAILNSVMTQQNVVEKLESYLAMPPARLEAALLEDARKSSAGIAPLLRIYREGRPILASKLEPEGLPKTDPLLMQEVIAERNLRWLPRMKSLMASGHALFAVGALHLYGDQGLLQLLRNNGFRISRPNCGSELPERTL